MLGRRTPSAEYAGEQACAAITSSAEHATGVAILQIRRRNNSGYPRFACGGTCMVKSKVARPARTQKNDDSEIVHALPSNVKPQPSKTRRRGEPDLCRLLAWAQGAAGRITACCHIVVGQVMRRPGDWRWPSSPLMLLRRPIRRDIAIGFRCGKHENDAVAQ